MPALSPIERNAAKIEKTQEAEARIAASLPKEVVVPKPRATVTNCMPHEHLALLWRHDVPFGTSYETVLSDPQYFRAALESAYGRLEPGHTIEVVPEDLSYVAHLFVVETNVGSARVVELFKKDLGPSRPSNIDGAATGGYRSFHIGKGRWKVKRLAFKKPSGNMQAEYIYDSIFNSEHEAEIFIRQTLIGAPH